MNTNIKLFQILAKKHNLTHAKSIYKDYHWLYLNGHPILSYNTDCGLSLWQQNSLYIPIDLNDPNSIETIEQTIKKAKQLNNYTFRVW